MDDSFLDRKLTERRAQNAFRRLQLPDGKTDFCSNDYLGIATGGLIEKVLAQDDPSPGLPHGSGGSRLLAGNYPLIEETEQVIAAFHDAPAGVLFNSGYDANLGVLSCVPQKNDTILYDQLSHASIRDGIRLSFARSFAFAHNDCSDLEKKLRAARTSATIPGQSVANALAPGSLTTASHSPSSIFVVTESLFSMDGDLAPLAAMVDLCHRYDACLIVDEAHATGIIGPKGEGLVQEQGLQEACFARIHTFGKAVGCHGAIVLGSTRLRDYLINFCRPLIYTTALPPASVKAIATAYELFPGLQAQRDRLRKLIQTFRQAAIRYERLNSVTPIQGVLVPGNEEVKELAGRLQDKGLDIRPILYPTVPRGGERLRIVLHAYNTPAELGILIAGLQK